MVCKLLKLEYISAKLLHLSKFPSVKLDLEKENFCFSKILSINLLNR